MKVRDSLLLATRLALGILFLVASVDKILNPAPFSDTVLNYQMLPEFVVNLFAIWLPVTEFVVGVLLIAGIWSKACSGLVFAMLCMFLIAIIQGVVRGIDTHCGCFTQGGKGSPISSLTILRDVAFLAVSGLSLWIETERPTWRLFRG
jgi:uncharacterized membrane protein YphA (DoxX/SURF4 family)